MNELGMGGAQPKTMQVVQGLLPGLGQQFPTGGSGYLGIHAFTLTARDSFI